MGAVGLAFVGGIIYLIFKVIKGIIKLYVLFFTAIIKGVIKLVKELNKKYKKNGTR